MRNCIPDLNFGHHMPGTHVYTSLQTHLNMNIQTNRETEKQFWVFIFFWVSNIILLDC